MNPGEANGFADVGGTNRVGIGIDAPRDARQASRRGISLGIAAGLAIFTGAALVATLRHQSWDFALIKAMNSVAGHSLPLDRVALVLTVSQLLQGVALVAMLWYLWFATNDVGARARLLAGIAAAVCAGFLSRALQLILPTHPRPLHTQALGFVMAAGVVPETLNHFNSFPATMVPSSSDWRPSSGATVPGWALQHSDGRQSSISQGFTRGITIRRTSWARSVWACWPGVCSAIRLSTAWHAEWLEWNKSTDRGSIRRPSCSRIRWRPCSTTFVLIGRGLVSMALQHDPSGGS